MGFYKYYYYVCKKGGIMKRILLILATLLALSAYAEHEYIPYVEEGKVWVSFEASGSTYKQVGIGEPTEINNTLYNKLYISTLDAKTNEITYTGLYGYIREENKKVYTRELNNQFETMIYDFDVQIGDSIQFQYGETVVDSIDTQIFYGKERDVFFVTHENAQIKDVWIEGIGSQEFPIMLSLTPNFGASGMMFHEYSYNYSTQEIFPTDKTPKPEFSYPEHKYIPLISPSNEWVEYGYKHYTQYTVGEMVELYGKNYYTINMTELSLPDQVISHSTYKSYYREEDKKVYMLNVDEDFLVFDFGANTGDTVILKPLYENQERKIIIDSIETTTLNGKERNVYYVDYGYDTDVWIEGIGPIHSFLFCEEIRWGGSGYSYLHYYYDNSTQYIYPEDREVIDFSAVHTLQADAHTLTLHRVGDALVAVFPTASVGEAITLYDATGRVVATQAVRPGATTATIDVAALPAGVYIARMGNGATSKIVI